VLRALVAQGRGIDAGEQVLTLTQQHRRNAGQGLGFETRRRTITSGPRWHDSCVARIAAAWSLEVGSMSISVSFVTGFGPVVRDRTATRRLYLDTLGIRFKEVAGGYLHTEALASGARAAELRQQARRGCRFRAANRW
jgi:hypothetical protein